jgi:hypothetical protein
MKGHTLLEKRIPARTRPRSTGTFTPARCPLKPALLALLRACVRLGTDDPVRLADALHLSPATVHTYYKRINQQLGTATRVEALLFAIREGWIVAPANASKQYDPLRMSRIWDTLMRTILLGSGLQCHRVANSPGGTVRRRGAGETSRMKLEDRDDFIDLVAQAVIDRIEERDRISGLVNMVVARVLELQKEEAALKETASAEGEASEGAAASERRRLAMGKDDVRPASGTPGANGPVEQGRNTRAEAVRRFESEKMSRRAVLAKVGLRFGAAALAALSVDDLARKVGAELARRSGDSKVASSVAHEFRNAGIAFADVNASGLCGGYGLRLVVGLVN